MCNVVVFQLILTLYKSSDEDGMILGGNERDCIQSKLGRHGCEDEPGQTNWRPWALGGYIQR